MMLPAQPPYGLNNVTRYEGSSCYFRKRTGLIPRICEFSGME